MHRKIVITIATNFEKSNEKCYSYYGNNEVFSQDGWQNHCVSPWNENQRSPKC